MPEAVGKDRAACFADQFDVIDIGRTVRPLICARQWRSGVMFMETLARDDRMLQISRQCLQPGCIFCPIIQRCLHRRNDVRGIGIPSEIVGNDNKMPVTARLQRCKFHKRISSFCPSCNDIAVAATAALRLDVIRWDWGRQKQGLHRQRCWRFRFV